MIVAFSRSSRPIRPISCESEIAASGSSCAITAAASCSASALTGEKTDEIATVRIPFAAKSAAARSQLVRLERGDPAPVELVAAVADAHVAAERVAQRVGQSTIGGSASVAGSPSLITPVGASRCASTTAFVKCVVPIITTCTRDTATPDGLDERADRRRDPTGHVRRRRRLRLGEHIAAVDEDGVGVRAADVDADAHG